MNIAYIDYQMFGKEDIIEAFTYLGHSVDIIDYPLYIDDQTVLSKKINAKLLSNKYNYVFTSNYYPLISEICNNNNVKYISWVYDSPLISLYHPSVNNPCNYIFIFDSHEVDTLRKLGINTVYYMPLAANTERLSKIIINEHDKITFESDVSLVASLYNESHNLYDRMYSKLNDYYKGFMDAIINAQQNIFGSFILDSSINNEATLDSLYKAAPYELVEGSLASLDYIYANYFLARKVAFKQRISFISAISGFFDMKVYTPGDLSMINTVKHMGTVDYLTDMNKVFKLSKINLNITLPSIQAGIPLRVIDIMANGGFVLTNYQKDLFDAFEPGKDFVYYTSLEEAINLIDYYLNNPEEIKEIGINAQKKICNNFTFTTQINKIINIVTQ